MICFVTRAVENVKQLGRVHTITQQEQRPEMGLQVCSEEN